MFQQEQAAHIINTNSNKGFVILYVGRVQTAKKGLRPHGAQDMGLSHQREIFQEILHLSEHFASRVTSKD